MTEMTGAFLKRVLEDVADNLFHPDPYYQQGGDMVRVGGLQYSIAPLAKAGSRIDRLTLNGESIDAKKTYKVAGWASVQQVEGEPIWDVVARWLRAQGRVQGVRPNQPEVMGLQGNQGIV
jgi:sulfur-oxidizing protein SoxB